jgi:hypothetical protein
MSGPDVEAMVRDDAMPERFRKRHLGGPHSAGHDIGGDYPSAFAFLVPGVSETAPLMPGGS